jgi:hypothetical protein
MLRTTGQSSLAMEVICITFFECSL